MTHTAYLRTAIRTAAATARCACCDDVYAVHGLTALEHDYTYVAAGEAACFDRDDRLCAPCRRSFEAEFGTEREDVYHVFDIGLNQYNG